MLQIISRYFDHTDDCILIKMCRFGALQKKAGVVYRVINALNMSVFRWR